MSDIENQEIADERSIQAANQEYKDGFLANNQDCEVDYFKILGLTKDSSLSDVNHVRHAHYKLALKFHPDKNGGTQESNDVMASVNAAVDVVKTLVKNTKNSQEEVCGAKSKLFPVQDDFLREVESEYGNFQNYFLKFSADQEASASVSAEPDCPTVPVKPICMTFGHGFGESVLPYAYNPVLGKCSVPVGEFALINKYIYDTDNLEESFEKIVDRCSAGDVVESISGVDYAIAFISVVSGNAYCWAIED